MNEKTIPMEARASMELAPASGTTDVVALNQAIIAQFRKLALERGAVPGANGLMVIGGRPVQLKTQDSRGAPVAQVATRGVFKRLSPVTYSMHRESDVGRVLELVVQRCYEEMQLHRQRKVDYPEKDAAPTSHSTYHHNVGLAARLTRLGYTADADHHGVHLSTEAAEQLLHEMGGN